MNIKIRVFTFFLIIITSAPLAFASNSDFREAYGAGRKLLQEGNWTKALEYFKPLEKNYVLLGDYLLFDMGVCYDKSGATDEAIASFRKIVSHYKNSPLYRRAYRKILEVEKDRDVTAALVDFDSYLKEFPQDSKALWEKACLLDNIGRKDEATSLLKEIFSSGNSYSFRACEALKARNYLPSYDEIRKTAQRLTETGNPGQVVSLLEGLALKDEEGKYLLGKAYFRLRRYRNAAQTLSGVSLRDSKYLLAISFLRTNDKESFYQLIEGLEGGGQKEFFDLRNLAAEEKRREGKFAEAAAMLKSMLTLHPEREEDINWSLAWLAIRQGRLSDAEKILSNLVNLSSSDHDKYVFWLGKVKNYQGQNGSAVFSQIKDKNSYYWFKAGKKETGPQAGNFWEGLKTEDQSQISEEMNRHFLRISELESLKMRMEAREEARRLIGGVTEHYIPAFVQLLIAMEDYADVIRLGIRYNYILFKYPLAYLDAVLKYSQAYKLDPLLIMAIMREESHFRCDAVSGAGALGIMQLMPSTARKLGNLKNNEELFEAEKNISLGTSYLSRLFAQLKLPHYVIAAYNAGEHNVGKWLAAGYRDEEEFTEDIPFGETKNYVLRVVKTYGITKNLYGNEIKSP